jgi:hypothetical protein
MVLMFGTMVPDNDKALGSAQQPSRRTAHRLRQYNCNLLLNVLSAAATLPLENFLPPVAEFDEPEPPCAQMLVIEKSSPIAAR